MWLAPILWEHRLRVVSTPWSSLPAPRKGRQGCCTRGSAQAALGARVAPLSSRTLPVGVWLAWPVAVPACIQVCRGQTQQQSRRAVPSRAPGRSLFPRLLPGPQGLAQTLLHSLTAPCTPAARAASGQRGSTAQPFPRQGLPRFYTFILLV